MNVTEPETIIVNLLRSQLDEVTRVGLSDRQTTDSESFAASGTATQFTLSTTATVVAFNNVKVDGSTALMYNDYQIDWDNQKVTFATAPSTAATVLVSFEKGSNWIYPSFDRASMIKSDYPKVVVTQLTENSIPQGMNEDDSYDTITFQIDVLAYKDQLCTISGETKEGPDVVDYLAREVCKTIKRDWRGQTIYKLFNPTIQNNFRAPFDESKNFYRRIIEIKFNSFNAGE